MKSHWMFTLIAAIPLAAGVLALQSCGGEGGATGDSDGLPGITAQFTALLTGEQRTAKNIGSETCASANCHGGATREDDDPIYTHWKNTKHAEEGVSCERCHGPGSAHKDNPTKENILTFPKSTSPVVCAQCHGPTHEEFNFSKHAKLITSPVDSARTNPAGAKGSRCISCHSGLFRVQVNEKGVDMATMPNETIKLIAENTLSTVPYTASCVTCHNPHASTGNVTDTGQEVQLRKKTFNTDTSQVGPGTTAAQFTNFDHVCAQCHNGRGTDPSDPKLTSGSSRPSMHDSNQFQMLLGFGGVEDTNDGPVQRNTEHANIPGQCSKCHMPDSRHSFTVSYDKSCAPCHTAADAANRISVTKDEILNGLVALRSRMEQWCTSNPNPALQDPDFWDYTSLVAAEGKVAPSQSLIPIELKRARHNYYFIIRSGDYGAHNAPYAKYLLTIANSNMNKLSAPASLLGRSQRLNRAQMLQIVERDRARAREADIKEEGGH